MHKAQYLKKLEYVDIRGVWPTYIKGYLAITLVGKKLDISLADARAVVQVMLQE